jgi:hypothetical protein
LRTQIHEMDATLVIDVIDAVPCVIDRDVLDSSV